MANDRLTYSTWWNMCQRCHKPNHKSYGSYGGRGIFVCPRWRDSYSNFFKDMGLRPSAKHSIDRINNDLGYAPDNCRWATAKEQSANQKNRKPRDQEVKTAAIKLLRLLVAERNISLIGLADRVAMSRNTVRRYVRDGLMPAERGNGKVFELLLVALSIDNGK